MNKRIRNKDFKITTKSQRRKKEYLKNFESRKSLLKLEKKKK